MHCVRRGHLYLGLFLLPWAVLYGATGFLFNHPAALPDQPMVTFGKSELAGAPMADPPAPAAVAEQVVAALNARAGSPATYQLVEPKRAKYTREFAFATVKTGDTEVSLLFDMTGTSGTVRSRPLPAVKPEEKAPFAIAGSKGMTPKAGEPQPARAAATGLLIDNPLHERVAAAVPVMLERTGFPTGDVTVTSVPDLSFRMSDGATTWTVTFNAQTGAVSGKSGEEPQTEELSTRRFLTRLHLAHGYPGEPNTKWFWAVIVDVMSFVLIFWGISGIFMWWQIKATRTIGFFILLISIAAATALGVGMHDVLTTK